MNSIRGEEPKGEATRRRGREIRKNKELSITWQRERIRRRGGGKERKEMNSITEERNQRERGYEGEEEMNSTT